MDVRLEDGTWGKTEKPVKIGDTVTLEVTDDNGNNTELTGVVAEVS